MRATPLAGPTSIRPCIFTPSPLPRSADVVIVGAGIIGLSIAWRALEVGKSVTIIDPRPASGASFVAGGMLGATAEVTFAEAGRVDRLRTARAEWDPFLDDLSRDQGRALPYVSTNTVVAGVHRSDQLEIDHLVKFQRSLNLRVEQLGRNELDALTPGLGRAIRQGFLLCDDAAVDNRLILQTLLDVIQRRNASLVVDVVEHLERRDGQFVITTSSGVITCEHAVIATGAAPALNSSISLPHIHPVAGVILRLKARPSTLQITTTIRAIVNGRSCYLVPRSQGKLVLGATSVERGYDLAVKAGEVHQLLDDARVVFPSIDEYEIIDAEVGLRPTTLDHHPIVEDLGEGLIVALGHYRNGFLLAPSTARRVIELLQKP